MGRVQTPVTKCLRETKITKTTATTRRKDMASCQICLSNALIKKEFLAVCVLIWQQEGNIPTTKAMILTTIHYSAGAEALLRPQEALCNLRVVLWRELQRDPQKVPEHGRQELWLSLGQTFCRESGKWASVKGKSAVAALWKCDIMLKYSINFVHKYST